jgi:hypothetical protein
MSHNPALLVEDDGTGVGVVRTSDGVVQRACAGAPCCGDPEACGGHGTGCCDCGTFFFVDRPGVTFPASVSVGGSGVSINECFGFFECGQSVVEQMTPSTYSILTKPGTDHPTCNLNEIQSAGNIHTFEMFNVHCDDRFSRLMEYTNDFSLAQASAILGINEGECATYDTPKVGQERVTVQTFGSAGSGVLFATSTGPAPDEFSDRRKICGPIVEFNITHWLDIVPSIGDTRIRFRVHAGRNGAGIRAFINMHYMAVCDNGRVVQENEWPFEVPGSITLNEGSSLGTSGVCDVSGTIQCAIPIACRQDGTNCLQVETYSLDLDFQIRADLRPVIRRCPGVVDPGDLLTPGGIVPGDPPGGTA